MSHYTVRPLTADDHPGVVALLNRMNPQPTTIAAFEAEVAGQDHIRMVVRQNDTVAAYGHASPVNEHGVFRIGLVLDVDLLPAAASALYAALEAAARERGASQLHAYVRHHRPGTRSLLEAHGFVLSHSYLWSELDLATFDPTPVWEQMAAAEAKGYRFCTMADLPAETAQRAFYALDRECSQDEPDAADAQVLAQPFEQYAAETFAGPDVDPAGLFVALKDGEWAGVSGLKYPPDSASAWTFFTGVRRAHRGAGLARILKTLGFRYAQSKGYSRIGTSNHSANEAMLTINRKMGFVQSGGTWSLSKRFS